jgi:hypothetical protein
MIQAISKHKITRITSHHLPAQSAQPRKHTSAVFVSTVQPPSHASGTRQVRVWYDAHCPLQYSRCSSAAGCERAVSALAAAPPHPSPRAVRAVCVKRPAGAVAVVVVVAVAVVVAAAAATCQPPPPRPACTSPLPPPPPASPHTPPSRAACAAAAGERATRTSHKVSHARSHNTVTRSVTLSESGCHWGHCRRARGGAHACPRTAAGRPQQPCEAVLAPWERAQPAHMGVPYTHTHTHIHTRGHAAAAVAPVVR